MLRYGQRITGQKYAIVIDFLKLHTRDAEVMRYFEQHTDLHWCKDLSSLNHDRETITSKTVRTFGGIAFEFHQHALNILFRPHYFFNDDSHNANDFSMMQCVDILRQFVQKFDVDYSALNIQNIEFGVNVISPIDVRDLVTWIKYHSKNEFRNHVGLPYSKVSYKVGSNGRANGYKSIKAYAKGVQYPEHCNANTFRFEVKSRQSKFIQQHLNVCALPDLLLPTPYLRMAETILKEFDSVLILDQRKPQHDLSKRDKSTLRKYLNVDTWYKYLNQNRNAYNKHFGKYYSLLNKTGSNLHAEVKNIIAAKLDALKSGCKFHTPKKIKVGANSTVYKGGNCTHLRFCKVTGLNISMQRDDSLMISHVGIKYYLSKEPQKFVELRQKFLSDNWRDADLKTQIKELAHNIRNYDSNQRISQRKRYPAHQINLLNFVQWLAAYCKQIRARARGKEL